MDIEISLEFHAKFMLHSNISNFQQSKYSNRFLELLLRALGGKYVGTTLNIWTVSPKSIVGPHGGPVISEGVQILQHYSEVIGPGGPNTLRYLDRGELFQGGGAFLS